MTSKYKILCLVDLQHDYYADGKSVDFDIAATQDTLALLKSQGMMYKMVNNKLAVLVKVDDAGVPVIPFTAGKTLSFYMMIDNVHFYNITNIGYQPSTAQRFYFTNLNQVKNGSTLYLNNTIPQYDNGHVKYEIGSLVTDGSGNVFEAIRANGSADIHGVGETAYWLGRGAVQYANDADLMEIAGSSYTFQPSAPGTSFTVNIYGINTATGAMDVPAKDAVVQTYTTAQSVIQVDLTNIPPGRYVIAVNGETPRTVYLAPDALTRRVFGIIDIYNLLPGTNDFSLLDNGGAVKENEFTLRFANRAVIWKYFASGDIQAITDTGGSYSFVQDVTNKYFYSSRPIPLSEKPVSTLSMTSVKFGELTTVANPATDRLNSISVSGETYFCIEKYLNY